VCDGGGSTWTSGISLCANISEQPSAVYVAEQRKTVVLHGDPTKELMTMIDCPLLATDSVAERRFAQASGRSDMDLMDTLPASANVLKDYA
jgi:hypothetical protein